MGQDTTLNYPCIVVNGGISFGSLQQIGEVLPSRSFGAAKIQTYVDIGNKHQGALMLQTPLVELKEQIPIKLCFYYDSKASDPNCPWHFAQRRFKKLPASKGRNPADTTAFLIEKDGREVTYRLDLQKDANYWWAPKQTEGTPFLSYDETQQSWVLFDSKSKAKEYYDSNGNLMRYEDAAGHVIQYEYKDDNDPQRLTAIIAPSGNRYELVREQTADGYRILFVMKTSNPADKKILQAQYFNNNNQLIETAFLTSNGDKKYAVNYQYSNNFLSVVTQTDGTELHFSLDGSKRLEAIRVGDKSITPTLLRYDYSQDHQNSLPVIKLEAADTCNTICLDDKGRIYKVDRPVDYPQGLDTVPPPDEKIYMYDQDGRVKTVAYPGGGHEEFEYGGEEGLLTRHIKANGQKTEYYYEQLDKRHFCKCVVRYLGDKPLVTRYVYDYNYKTDKVFLRFEISPAMRVKEYRPDEWGNVGTVITYLDDFYSDQPAYQANEVPSLTAMLDWVKTKDPQRVGLTTYIYEPEQRSQILFTQSYGHVDTKGIGIDDNIMSKDNTYYDIFGNLIKHTAWQSLGYNPAITCQEFDLLNRLTKTINAVGKETKHAYLDDQHKVVTEHPNGRIETTTYDSKGLMLQHTKTVLTNGQQQSRSNKYQRDDMGRVVFTDLPDGRQKITFSDYQGRLGFTVTPSGIVEEKQYNLQKRFTAKIQYANRIDPQQLKNPDGYLPTVYDLRELIKPDLVNDRCFYEFMDTSDRPYLTVDAENYAIQTIYDTLNRPIAKIAYAASLTDAQLNQLKEGKAIQLSFDSDKTDRCTRTFYDADGFIIGEQDARGYVTEYVRNGAGWVTKKTLYATPQIINLQITDFAQIRPEPKLDKDASTYYFYNNRGLCEIEVDAEGYITEKSYLAGGLVDKTIRYQTKVKDVDSEWLTHRGRPPRLPATTTEDLVTQHQYDLMDREISALNAHDNAQTNTVYDNMGHVVASDHQDIKGPKVINGDTFRATQTQYDPWEQIICEANPFVAEKLKHVELDPNLNSLQREAEKKAIWDKFSKRHFYDATGLKIKTAACITDANQNKDKLDDQITFYYYDLERRPIILITVLDNDQVMIQEDSYNSFGEVVGTYRYSQSLSAEIIKQLTGGYLTEAFRKVLDGIKDKGHDVITSYVRDRRGLIKQKVDAEDYTSTFNYNAYHECIEEFLPVANKQPSLKITREFDTGGHEITTIKQADNQTTIVKRRFDNLYGKMTKFTDEIDGQLVDQPDRYCEHLTEYDCLGRGIKKSTAIAGKERVDATLQLDAFGRTVTEKDALNQTTQYAYNRDKRSCVVRKLTADHENKIFAIVGNNIFDEIISSTNPSTRTKLFRHAPDGQLLQRVDELGHTTTERYNLLGWRVERENANKTKTKLNRNRAGLLISKVLDDGGFNYTTKLTRDVLGNVATITDPCNNTRKNQFDRRGKLIQQTNLTSKAQQQRQYNGQGSLISKQQGDQLNPDQHLQTYQRDGFDRAIGDTVDPVTETHKDALAIQTQQKLNAAGKVSVEIDANGNKTFNFYDPRGNHCYQVLPDGGITEWSYNAVDKVAMQRKYATAIKLEDLAKLNEHTPLDALRAITLPMESQGDAVTHYFYEANQRERFSIALLWDVATQQFKGIVKEKRYDAMEQIFEEAEYAKYLEAIDFSILTTEQIVTLLKQSSDPSQDSHRFYLRDVKNQVAFTIDAENYITQQIFSRTGKIITKVRYAIPVLNPRELVAMPIDIILSTLKLSTDDRYEYFVFDNLDRPLYSVNGEGSVIRFTHDGNHNVTEEYHFAEKIKVPQDYAQVVSQLNTLKQNPELDRVTKKEYDADNRLIKVTDACGNSDHYQRDALGNIIAHTDRNGAIWKTPALDRANRALVEVAPTVDITTVKEQEATTQTAAVEKHQKHDKLGHLMQQVLAANTTEKRIINSRYDACNRLIEMQLENITVEGVGQVNLTQKIRYNVQGLKIAEKDFNDVWTFYIYDNQGREIYRLAPYKKLENNMYQYTVIKTERINAAGYGTNGHVTHEVRFATPIDLEIKPDYQKTGIPRTLLDAFTDKAEVKSNAKDRHLYKQYNRRGELIKLEQNELFYYLPATESSKAAMGYARPTTVQKWNAFGECCYQARAIGENILAATTTWFDHAGRETVIIDPILRTKQYAYNSFGEESARAEYSNCFAQALSPSLTLMEVMAKLETLASDQDRHFRTEYTRLGKVSKRITSNVVTQKASTIKEGANKGLPSLEDEPAQDLVTETYTYTPTEKIATITDANGGTQYIYYNAWDIEIALTEVMRIQEDGDTKIPLIPLTHIGINAHGQTVAEKRFASGAKVELAAGAQHAAPFVAPGAARPEPIAQDPNADPEELTQYDTRGFVNYKLDAKKNGKKFGYTATGKIAKEEWKITNFETKAPFNPKISTDQKRYRYTLTDKPEFEVLIRDGEIQQITQSFFNEYGEYIGEGPGDGTMPLRHDRDPVGNIWRTNKIHDDGKTYLSSSTIILRDLLGQESMQLESAKLDLIKVTYEQLEKFIRDHQIIRDQQELEELERTETTRDLVGRMVAKTSPANYRFENNQLKILARRHYGHDNWDNLIWEENNLGHRTESVFNRCNKLLQTIQPEIEVMDDAGKMVKLRPTTRYGYNKNMQMIGTTNARGYTELSILDAAGHEIKKILGDALESRIQIWNALDQIIIHADARGKRWQHSYDLNGNLRAMRSQMGLLTEYGYNELNFCSEVFDTIDPAKTPNIPNAQRCRVRYNQSITGTVSVRIEQLGWVWLYDKRYVPELKLVIETETGPDGKALIWQHTYFGVLITHIDLGGAVYTCEYDKKLQLVEQKSGPVSHGNHLTMITYNKTEYTRPFRKPYQVTYYQVIQSPTPSQYLKYTWLFGQKVKIEDRAHNKVTEFGYDLEGQGISVESTNNGQLVRKVTSRLNAMGWEIECVDTEMSITMAYDAVGNERSLTSGVYIGNQAPVVTIKENIFDPADRVIEDGDLKIEYADGFRKREKRNNVTTNLSYNDDGLLLETQGGAHTLRDYDPTGYVSRYEDKAADFLHELKCNENGLQIWDRKTSKGNWLAKTTFEYDRRGVLSLQTVDGHPNYRYKDTFTPTYRDFDERKMVVLEARRFIDKPDGGYDIVYRNSNQYHDANGNLTGILAGGFDPGYHDDSWWYKFYPVTPYEVTADNLTVRKWMLIMPFHTDAGPDPTTQAGNTKYLYNVKGHPKVSYTNYGSLNGFGGGYSVNMGYNGYGVRGGKGFQWLPQSGINKQLIPEPSLGNSSPNLNIMSAIQSVSESYPPPIPSKVVAGENQTFVQLAQTWLGDGKYAEAISNINQGIGAVGGMRAGSEVRLPQVIPHRNSVSTHITYQQFMTTMVENIFPHLITPLPEEKGGGLLEAIVEVVATVAAFCIAGPLGAGAAVASILGVTPVIGAAVVAGLTQAAIQGVAKGVGLLKEVSWQQAVGAGIGAGVLASSLGTDLAQTLDTLLEAGKINLEVLGDAILQSGKVAVATELLSMAAGVKKTFDFENVLVSMGSTLSSLGIAKATSNEAARTTLNSLSNTAINSVVHNNYQLESMAVNLLSSAVQYGAQKGIEHLNSKHYQAAQSGETVKQNNAPRVSRRNSQVHAAPHHAATYFDDPLFDEDLTQTLDPRIDVNDPKNAQRLANGVGNLNQAQKWNMEQKNRSQAQLYSQQGFLQDSKAKENSSILGWTTPVGEVADTLLAVGLFKPIKPLLQAVSRTMQVAETIKLGVGTADAVVQHGLNSPQVGKAIVSLGMMYGVSMIPGVGPWMSLSYSVVDQRLEAIVQGIDAGNIPLEEGLKQMNYATQF